MQMIPVIRIQNLPSRRRPYLQKCRVEAIFITGRNAIEVPCLRRCVMTHGSQTASVRESRKLVRYTDGGRPPGPHVLRYRNVLRGSIIKCTAHIGLLLPFRRPCRLKIRHVIRCSRRSRLRCTLPFVYIDSTDKHELDRSNGHAMMLCGIACPLPECLRQLHPVEHRVGPLRLMHFNSTFSQSETEGLEARIWSPIQTV